MFKLQGDHARQTAHWIGVKMVIMWCLSACAARSTSTTPHMERGAVHLLRSSLSPPSQIRPPSRDQSHVSPHRACLCVLTAPQLCERPAERRGGEERSRGKAGERGSRTSTSWYPEMPCVLHVGHGYQQAREQDGGMRLRLFQRPARLGISVVCAARRVNRTPESGSAEENCFG